MKSRCQNGIQQLRVSHSKYVLQLDIEMVGFGSVQVSKDTPTLPWAKSRVWVGAWLGLGLALKEGWVDTSPESRIDQSRFLGTRLPSPGLSQRLEFGAGLGLEL